MGISSLIPKSFKRAMLKRFRQEWPNWQRELTKDFPEVELEEKHVANTRLLPSRNHLLDLLPKGAIASELGVAQGDFTREIIDRTQPKKLHLVDVWASARYHDGLSKLVADKFKSEIDSGQVEINRGYSTEWLPKYEDGYFDFIYIDTDHTYGTTAQELELARTKMKKGGIIAGHDFTIGAWTSLARYGVVEAVHEFCVKYDWELIYLTNETDRLLSFAIREIGAGE